MTTTTVDDQRAGTGAATDGVSRTRRRLLLAEGHAASREVISRTLGGVGFEVTARPTLTSAREALQRSEFSLAVIGLDLPDGDGLDLVQRLVGRMPVIALGSGDDSNRDLRRAFDAGVDDYLARPVSPQELIVRVRAVQRRPGPGTAGLAPERIVHGIVEIDLLGRRVFVGGQEAGFTKTEFDLLVALARRPGQACTRGELTELVWQAPLGSYSAGNLTEHIRRIRRKLGRAAACVVTVTKFGYRFDPEGLLGVRA